MKTNKFMATPTVEECEARIEKLERFVAAFDKWKDINWGSDNDALDALITDVFKAREALNDD